MTCEMMAGLLQSLLLGLIVWAVTCTVFITAALISDYRRRHDAR